MSAIEVIVGTYVRLRNEPALFKLRHQIQRVLETTDGNNPFHARLRNQCAEEIALSMLV
jgi:hypothetical protein